MSEEILFYIAVGFLAQMVDGAIGMAYGITSTSVMLSAGVPPATASACVHAAEMFTTGASGLSHWKFGNVDKRIIWRLAIPGMIGGVLGAYVLTAIDGNLIKPYISAYLLLMGIFILYKAIHRKPHFVDEPPTNIVPLGLFGGFVDAIGGGGWGPMVTSTLLGQGGVPRYTIGSVNLAEFFVTAAISATFVFTIGLELWPIITGLIIGGIMAAPLAALIAKQVPAKPLMIIVGFVVIVLSARTIAISGGLV
ncbi:MAG: sulfite exporter TauE/SafE family protein [Hyphomicrobium sp.]|nr:sulfite exporter TauE/SafE family protein [Hyphomicrobium sp.]